MATEIRPDADVPGGRPGAVVLGAGGAEQARQGSGGLPGPVAGAPGPLNRHQASRRSAGGSTAAGPPRLAKTPDAPAGRAGGGIRSWIVPERMGYLTSRRRLRTTPTVV